MELDLPLSMDSLARIGADIDHSLHQFRQQADGKQLDCADEPMITFLRRVNELVRNPIQHPKHAEMLQRALTYLMAEEPEPFRGTVEEAMDAAVEEAMDSAGPREQVLLALVRHRASLLSATA